MTETIAREHADVIGGEREHRLQKLEALRARGITPYPVDFRRDHTVADVRARFDDLAADATTAVDVRVAGRLMLLRRHGGLVFATLADQTGSIQLLAARDELGDDAFADVEALDRGDWVGATGRVMTTHTGELTVEVSELRLLAKALRALPDKHRGLTDPEVRLRERYLDLVVNPETRRIFDARSAVISAIRRELDARGFTEVETPVLEPEAGGAAARPFVTHHNALDVDLYLRIALELHLKRLVVGGFERVYEIGRVFRNEGLDTRHNPEFTLLEAYQALGDYRDMMELVETLASRAALAANGTTLIEIGGRPVDLAPPWRRVTMAELIEEHAGVRMHPSMPIEKARAICSRLGIHVESGWGAGRLMSEVYDATVEHALVEPTFVLDHPREISPLARTHRDDDQLVERFEAVVGGRELANAYTELNDPVDQRARFELEAAAKAAGDAEAQDVDEDYIRALEYGLPPTGGLGIGIDRLVMLIAGASAIREVILFPAMRPEAVADAPAETGLDDEPAPAAAPLPVPAAGTPAAVPARPPRARMLGRLTGLAGLLSVVAGALDPHRLGLGTVVDDVDVRAAGHVAAIVVGLALLVLAPAVGHGQRRAWAAAVVLFAAGGTFALLRGPDPFGVLAATTMVVALVWCRDDFRARPAPAAVGDAVRFLQRYVPLAFAFSIGALLLERHHVEPRLTAGGAAETTLLGLVGIDGPYRYTDPFLATWFPAALLAVGVAGAAIAAVLALRGVRASAPSVADRQRAEGIVRAHGTGTLDYFALRPDKSWFFSAAGDALIAYTYVDGYALAAADPVGPVEAQGRVIGEFLAFCRERGWHVAFLAAREADLPLYRRYGLRGVYLGDEAVLRCDRFTLSGSGMKRVRASVRRAGRRCTFRLVAETDASPDLCTALNDLRRRWRGGDTERGFTMELGGEVTGRNRDLLLAIAFGPDGQPLGFLRLVPCRGAEPGWSLDLMQHDPGAPNGITEFLIANAALELGRRGDRRLSLNFAAWGRLFDPDAPLGAAQRVQRRVARWLGPFFQIESLRDFNAKFDPEWVPRSIVVEDLEAIPRVGLLYASVEGFVRLPLVGRRLVPSVPATRSTEEQPA